VRSTLSGNAEAVYDPCVKERRDELINEANYLIGFIKDEYSDTAEDPLADAAVLSDCIKRGILDAPHIVKGGEFRGTLQTRVKNGKCVAWDNTAGSIMDERTRLKRLTGKTRRDVI